MGRAGLFPESHAQARLCVKCQELDFFALKLTIQDTWQDLATNQKTCDFCELRWRACLDKQLEATSPIRFDRVESMLHLNEHSEPALSICRGPEEPTTESRPSTNRIKIGLPNLTITSNQHFALMRQWLEHCDGQHQCKPHPKSIVPTRVLDLGTGREPTVWLYETKRGESFSYIALSHCWGWEQHFMTTEMNIEQHKKGIAIEKLPRTFQHAIKTTRELGIRYLWIDSICIIQGDHGDFDKEAEKMESVFSSAYCVIAASSARSQQNGFLNPRKERKVVRLTKEGRKGGVYVSVFSDDFKEHVVHSPLSERGWVLQERALARRTIYFTEWQTYWECGDGIRCESMTRMDNKLISFLGDPNFPSKLSGDTSDRGEKIRFYEGLYKQYSRLTLSRDSDRPIAIAGLEKRLIHDLKSSGGFGVFDDERSLLQRSLLWQRGSEFPTLEKIAVLSRVPTWSWMAYKGGIDYLDPPFGEVDWNISEIRGNWFGKGNRTELSAITREFRMATTGTPDLDTTWDIPKEINPDLARLKCVVVGVKRQRGVLAEKKTHYVLIVRLWEQNTDLATEETEIYERVGVGKMLGEYIDLDNSQPRDWVKIR
ncbi:heterokaryon incompatibility protein-domain-containing protein [Copromyces sp. CBS 386.78]|nr:heterokaryon incompatibility protein-domain-containing protein [Copromyces sp. CBS 386.78]